MRNLSMAAEGDLGLASEAPLWGSPHPLSKFWPRRGYAIHPRLNHPQNGASRLRHGHERSCRAGYHV